MWMRLAAAILALGMAGLAGEARALCIYRGVMYAQSTITGEFRESSLVVKGTVIETHDLDFIDEEATNGFYLAVATIRVDEVFKGVAGREVLLISQRNSGGFYVNAGEQYLFFLRPPEKAGWSKGYRPDQVAALQHLPRARRINNGCGQSVRWSEVSDKKRAVLAYETRRLRALVAR